MKKKPVKKAKAKSKKAKSPNICCEKMSKQEKIKSALHSAMSDYSGDPGILNKLLEIKGAKSQFKKILSEEKKYLSERKKDISRNEKKLSKHKKSITTSRKKK